jgi:hypothetical protein
MMLAPAERDAMPAREIVKTALIVQRNGLPDRPPEIGKLRALSDSIFFLTLRRAGAALGAGRAVIVNSRLPFRPRPQSA